MCQDVVVVVHVAEDRIQDHQRQHDENIFHTSITGS